MLPNNNYLVRKIGTNKTQVLHCLRMPQFTPQQPLLDIRITSQEWKSDPDVSIKHDDLYARAWECECERPIFEASIDDPTPPNSPEIAVQSDLLRKRGAHQEPQKSVTEIFPQR